MTTGGGSQDRGRNPIPMNVDKALLTHGPTGTLGAVTLAGEGRNTEVSNSVRNCKKQVIWSSSLGGSWRDIDCEECSPRGTRLLTQLSMLNSSIGTPLPARVPREPVVVISIRLIGDNSTVAGFRGLQVHLTICFL
ncbi:MAG: hypothetical protein R6V83_04535 [Candidatus Thorarchaeota archaeon]